MNRLKHVFILTIDFIGLLVIIFIIIFALNFFKILSLSTVFPKYFGFLPQISQKQEAVQPTSPPVPTGIVWEKQASSDLISNYSGYFKNSHIIPINTYGNDPTLLFVSGAMSAYNKDHIQVITTQGITVYQLTNTTVFRKNSPAITTKSQGSKGASRITAVYKNSADFFTEVPFGGFIQVIYRINGDSKLAYYIDYFSDYRY